MQKSSKTSMQNIDITYQELLSQFFIQYFTSANNYYQFMISPQTVKSKNKLSTERRQKFVNMEYEFSFD